VNDSSDSACVYCGSDLSRYDPVYLLENDDGSGSDGGDRREIGGFCNYACLNAHVEEAELVYGTACEWSPE